MSEVTFDHTNLNTELAEAEGNLHAWATGHLSTTNLHLANSLGERGETLLRVTRHDAAELDLAMKRVVALRLLCGLTPEGTYGA